MYAINGTFETYSVKVSLGVHITVNKMREENSVSLSDTTESRTFYNVDQSVEFIIFQYLSLMMCALALGCRCLVRRPFLLPTTRVGA